MSFIIFYNSELSNDNFDNEVIKLNSQQSFVKLTYDETTIYNEYLFRTERQIRIILNDISGDGGERLEKLYISREKASEDPQAFQIFLQDYIVLQGNPLSELVFRRALFYNSQTFTQWLKDLEGNPLELNTDGRFFKAIIGSFAFYLKNVPEAGGGITESQRQNLDFILKPVMNFIYMGDWLSAAEFYYLGYPNLKTPEYPTGRQSIKQDLIDDLTNNGKTPTEVQTIMGNFVLFEAQLDVYIAKMYKNPDGTPVVVNPNPIQL